MSDNFYNPNFSTNYEYIPKGTSQRVISDIPDITKHIEQNCLEFSGSFRSGDFFKGELYKIAEELKSTARYFGEQQGLDYDIDGSPSNILNHIYAYPSHNHVVFGNNAQDEYGYYAGHIEFGHYTRNRKKFIPARPFMRPALYAVSKTSKGEFKEFMSEILMSIFRDSGKGYQGVSNLTFGHHLGALYHYSSSSSEIVNAIKSENTYYQKIRDTDKKGRPIITTRRITERSYDDLGSHSIFPKRMADWSIKRHSNSVFQSKIKGASPFNEKGRNVNNIKRNTEGRPESRNNRNMRPVYKKNREALRAYREHKREVRQKKWKELRTEPKGNFPSMNLKVGSIRKPASKLHISPFDDVGQSASIYSGHSSYNLHHIPKGNKGVRPKVPGQTSYAKQMSEKRDREERMAKEQESQIKKDKDVPPGYTKFTFIDSRGVSREITTTIQEKESNYWYDSKEKGYRAINDKQE